MNQRPHEALQTSLNAEVNPWYRNSGKVFPREGDLSGWATVIQACQGIIAFDAVLCRGPRHNDLDTNGTDINVGRVGPNVASIALRGCQICQSVPEGPANSADAPSENLPLLLPVPRHSASVKVAQQPPVSPRQGAISNYLLFARCLDCCRNRWCEDDYDPDKREVLHSESAALEGQKQENIVNVKVYNGLCVEHYLGDEVYQSSDSIWACY